VLTALLSAALALGARAQAQSAEEGALTVCSSAEGPENGPIVTISYSTAPASLHAVVVSPKKGAQATRREQPVKRFGGGRSRLKPRVYFQGEGFELEVDTAKPDKPKYPARLRVLSPFGTRGVRTADLSCLRFDFDGDEQTCASQGGLWQPQPPACIWNTSDDGHACKDSSECESACVAPQGAAEGKKARGHCFGKTSLSGACVVIVADGVAGRTECSD